MTPPVIIPAAGLGTRLADLAAGQSKEMLPLAGQPLLLGALLEAAHAGAAEVAVVIAPRKVDLCRWLSEVGPDQPFRLRVVEQTEPLGVVDAVARARRALGHPTAWAVLFPDHVHLPGQTGLRQVLEAGAGTRATHALGLVRVTSDSAGRTGGSAHVALDAEGEALRPIHRLWAAPHTPGAIHTALAHVQDLAFADAVQRATPPGASADSVHAQVLDAEARAGRLFGVLLDGALLDTGIPAGYRDAVRRFDSGAARWGW